MSDPDAHDPDESAAQPARNPLDEPIPIWPNLKWALIVLMTTVAVWWIAGPIVRWLGIDDLTP